jgi:septal ring factor EnvC (AmiA/AmiB activator)
VEYNKVYLSIDFKSIVIILLSLLVVGLIFFNNSGKDIKKYEQEIGNLNTKNKELLLDNDSIKNLNLVLSKDINDLNIKIDEINTQIVENEDLIKRLKKKKSEIPTNVNVMDADGVASGISDYLKRRD